MSNQSEYKPTLFDRHGPAAADYLKAWGNGLMVCGLTLSAIVLKVGFSWSSVLMSAVAGALAGAMPLLLANGVGGTWKLFLMGGSSTPYKEQYSFQEALVMQGKLDEALESFEGIIRQHPDAIDARIRAAELYAREKATRAAQVAPLCRDRRDTDA